MSVRILLVDDNPYDRELAAIALRDLESPCGPAQCVGVGDWQDARRHLASEVVDVILLDYHLPETSGLEILSELAENLAPPVIMLTGQADLATALETLRAGACEYVAKAPGWETTICLVVMRVLRRVQLEHDLAEAQRRLAAHAAELERAVADRTALVRAQAGEIERLFLKSEEAARLKNEIVANLSHELRTPLNVILGYVELLRDGMPLGEQDAGVMLEKVQLQAEALRKIIESLLALVRLRSNKEGVDVTRFTLAEVLQELRGELSLLRLTARASGKSVVRWHGPPASVEVHADRGKVRTIAYHLLQNAIKFAPNGTVALELTKTADGGVVVTARDDGIGFPEEMRAAAFEDFRQGDGSTTRHFEGLGIGLGIVRRYVDILGGTIDIDSAPGTGTTVVVTLPPPTAFLVADTNP